MKQLKMMRYGGKLNARPLPEGYRFVFFGGTDEEINDWLEICSHGLNKNTDYENFENAILKLGGITPENDLFFIVDPTGRRVATTTCRKAGNELGGIHMVAALDEYKGKGLGHCLIDFGVNQLASRGYTKMTLTTDDFRLGAIKTYLDAGFCPVIFFDPESDMTKRWDSILKTLNYAKEVRYITE